MAWKKKLSSLIMGASDALEDATDMLASDSPSRHSDLLAKSLERGFVAVGLALAGLYEHATAERKRELRSMLGADVVDKAVELSISRGVKEAA